MKLKVPEELNRLEELILKRRHLITSSIAFKEAESYYLTNCTEWRGIRYDDN